MKISFIVGSHRKESESRRVADFLTAELKKLDPAAQTYLLDLGKTPLPLWDEGRWGKETNVDWKATWGPISNELKDSDGVVVISPEYAGMVPAALKNFFLHVDGGELSHKPGLIVGVSSSRGGAYPVAELRASSYKNLQLNWIPEHLIFRDTPKMLHQEEAVDADDKYIRDRSVYALKILLEYAKALESVRSSGVVDRKTYPFGL